LRGASRGVSGIGVGVLLAVAVLAAGCDSTIHRQSNIGGVDTLSLDAKQRLMLVGNRAGYKDDRVTCTEPSPDALVARAAVLAASGSLARPGTPATGDETTVGGGVSGGTSETAASIGFRDHTVQMLRDGYFRLCEAYLNGALSKEQYEHMITNADTFMVVVSALQILGSNPVAPAVAIQAGGVTATAAAPAAGQPGGTASATVAQPSAPVISQVTGTSQTSAENAAMAKQIVQAYLNYRANLTRYVAEQKLRQMRAKPKSKHP
jgi:hypothetical protein